MQSDDLAERVRQRKRGRELAAELLDLLDTADEDDLTSQPLREGLMAGFRAWLDLPEKPEPGAMTKQEAVAFEGRRIEFGQYEGKTYSEIPIRYLAWLVDQQVALTSYIKSDAGQKRLEDEF